MNMKNTYHIAQFGTYDIESLGDTTFPKALFYGLKKYLSVEIELFSMNECVDPYNQNGYVYAFDQFAQRNREEAFDAVILGGGEFLHFSPMSVMISGKQTVYPNGYIWKEPLECAQKWYIPAIINCVGVSYDLTKKQADQLLDYIETVKYWSVRDKYSQRRLESIGINADCIADNLWYLNQMYPKTQQDAVRQKLQEKFMVDLTTPYIVVQYGTTKDVKGLIEQLKEIKNATGYRICLMAVNYCHEDRTGMHLLAQAGKSEFETLDMYLQPPEMIAVISGARAFLGTSLHGNLTAASYDVPFVGIDMYPNFVSKMDGIFSMLGCENYLVPQEAGLAAAYFAREKDTMIALRISEKIQEMQKRLDEHFAKIAEIIKEA